MSEKPQESGQPTTRKVIWVAAWISLYGVASAVTYHHARRMEDS